MSLSSSEKYHSPRKTTASVSYKLIGNVLDTFAVDPIADPVVLTRKGQSYLSMWTSSTSWRSSLTILICSLRWNSVESSFWLGAVVAVKPSFVEIAFNPGDTLGQVPER